MYECIIFKHQNICIPTGTYLREQIYFDCQLSTRYLPIYLKELLSYLVNR